MSCYSPRHVCIKLDDALLVAIRGAHVDLVKSIFDILQAQFYVSEMAVSVALLSKVKFEDFDDDRRSIVEYLTRGHIPNCLSIAAAVQSGEMDLLTRFLEQSSEEDIQMALTETTSTKQALHSRGNIQAFRVLLNHPVIVALPDKIGAFILCADHDCDGYFKILLEYSEISEITKLACLKRAMVAKSNRILSLLLPMTILSIDVFEEAIKCGNCPVLHFILEHTRIVSEEARAQYFDTVMNDPYLVERYHMAAVLLPESRLNEYFTRGSGMSTMLHLVSMCSTPVEVFYLLDRGADYTLVDEEGFSFVQLLGKSTPSTFPSSVYSVYVLCPLIAAAIYPGIPGLFPDYLVGNVLQLMYGRRLGEQLYHNSQRYHALKAKRCHMKRNRSSTVESN